MAEVNYATVTEKTKKKNKKEKAEDSTPDIGMKKLLITYIDQLCGVWRFHQKNVQSKISRGIIQIPVMCETGNSYGLFHLFGIPREQSKH